MILLIFLYDEYIDRPKLSEQKNPFEYIVPPPTSGVGAKSMILVTRIPGKRNFCPLFWANIYPNKLLLKFY